MQHEKNVIVDDITYHIKHLQTSDSIRVLAKLQKIVLPTVGKLMGGKQLDEEDFLSRDWDIESAAVYLGQNLGDSDEVLEIVKKLFSTVLDENEMGIDFEKHFRGRMMHLGKLLTEVLKHNYEDFFGVIDGLQSRIKSRKTTDSIQEKTLSSGLSGDQSSPV